MKISKSLFIVLVALGTLFFVAGCSGAADDSVPKEGVNAGKDVPQQSVTPRTRPGEEAGGR